MVFAPTRSATEMSPIHPEAQADGDVGTTQPISTTASYQFLLKICPRGNHISLYS